MKQWLLERYLPMWAKETVMKDNARLHRENRALSEENTRLRCYIRGLHVGLRSRRLKGGECEAS